MKALHKIFDEQSGFTLIELMIATVIFSMVLVIIMYAFLFVSDDYLKGNVEAQTQATARAVIEQVSEDIQLDNFVVTPVVTSGGINMICIGNHRYSFQYNKEVGGPSPDGANNAMVVDTLSGCSSTSSPQALNGGSVQGTDLLGEHMRLGNFTIVPNVLVPGQYTVSVTIAYGDDPAQSGPLTVVGAAAPYKYTCPDLNVGGKFCASSTLSTVVQQRVVGD